VKLERGKIRRELVRKDAILPRDVGVRETFNSPAEVVGLLEDLNPTWFSNREGADTGDATRDFMDSLDVVAKKLDKKAGMYRDARAKKLAKTARGREILALDGAAQVRAMLGYLVGLAGRRRRFVDVPWQKIRDYGEVVPTSTGLSVGGLESDDRGGLVIPVEAWDRPLDEIAVVLRESGQVSGAEKIDTWQSAQPLWRAAARLRYALESQGGQPSNVAMCLGPERVAKVGELIEALEGWAKDPERVPENYCDPAAPDYRCHYGPILDHVSGVLAACEVPVGSVEWPTRYAAIDEQPSLQAAVIDAECDPDDPNCIPF
jgi:hypothetical protein